MTQEKFMMKIKEVQERARKQGKEYVDINAGDVHRAVGGYPGDDHRMATCCGVMNRLMGLKDEVIATPLKGKGASHCIRYFL